MGSVRTERVRAAAARLLASRRMWVWSVENVYLILQKSGRKKIDLFVWIFLRLQSQSLATKK